MTTTFQGCLKHLIQTLDYNLSCKTANWGGKSIANEAFYATRVRNCSYFECVVGGEATLVRGCLMRDPSSHVNCQ